MNAIKSFLFTVQLVCLFVSSVYANNWISSGMGGGGGLEKPEISPHDGNVVYVSSDMYGVYKTNNFGKNWDLLPYKQLTNVGGDVFKFTGNRKTLYAIHQVSSHNALKNSLKSYPVKSINAGKTFIPLKELPAASSSERKKVTFASQIFADSAPGIDNRIVINLYDRVVFSRNGGLSYQDIGVIADKEYGIRVAGVHWDGRHIVVATTSGLYVSSNNGRRFTRMRTMQAKRPGVIINFSSARQGGVTRFYVLAYVNNQQLNWEQINSPKYPAYNIARFIGTHPKGMAHPHNNQPLLTLKAYKMDWDSNQGNKNQWQELPYNPYKDFIPYWVSSAKNDINTVYLSGLDVIAWPEKMKNGKKRLEGWGRTSVKKSRDGGQHWKSVFNTDNCQGADGFECDLEPATFNKNLSLGWYGVDHNWEFAGYVDGFAVDPNNSKRVMLNTNVIHVSENGGKSWHQAYLDRRDQNPPGVFVKNSPVRSPPVDTIKAYSGVGIEPTEALWLKWFNGKLIAGMTDLTAWLSETCVKKNAKKNAKKSAKKSAKNCADNCTRNKEISWKSLIHTRLHDDDITNTTHIIQSNDGKTLYATGSSYNDLYKMDRHDAMSEFESSHVLSSCIHSVDPEAEIHGSLRKSEDAKNWDNVILFNCPAIWIESDKQQEHIFYVSLIHKRQGGIFKINLKNKHSPKVSRLVSPNGTNGNPYTIHTINDNELVTSWGPTIKYSAKGNQLNKSSGVFVYNKIRRHWTKKNTPQVPAMRLWTKDLVLDPGDATGSTWYAGISNPHGRFETNIEGKPYSNKEADAGGGLFRTRNRGNSWKRISPPEIVRVNSVGINPNNHNEAYLTTMTQGLWRTDNLQSDAPVFIREKGFKFRKPTRVFYSPKGVVWVTTDGGGLWHNDVSAKQSQPSGKCDH